jgi:hypothetical protein
VCHNGPPWLVPCSRFGTARFVDVLEKDTKPLVVEYSEELPELFKMTEVQFAAEVRFLTTARLFELGKRSSGKAAAMAFEITSCIGGSLFCWVLETVSSSIR